MLQLDRRQVLKWFGSACALGPVSQLLADEKPDGCTLGFSTYAIPGRSLEESLSLIADAGYDSVEITVTDDRDSSPEQMPSARRRHVHNRLRERGLKVSSLMEHLPVASDDGAHRQQLERLKKAAELGRDLSPGAPPVIQTILGGREWAQVRSLFRDRLGDWLEVGRDAETVVCIKPHRGNAMSRPEQAAWLIEQLGHSPWLRMCYDYSHFAFRDMPLEETIRTSLPITAHIAVKDAVQTNGRVRFELPGTAGTIDYVRLLKSFYAGGYRGDFCVEVSSQLWRAENYDPLHALRTCHRNLSAAFEAAVVPRRGA